MAHSYLLSSAWTKNGMVSLIHSHFHSPDALFLGPVLGFVDPKLNQRLCLPSRGLDMAVNASMAELSSILWNSAQRDPGHSMRKVVQGYFSMKSIELNKLNILPHCRTSRSLYHASVYCTLNDLGLSGVPDGPGHPNLYWEWVSDVPTYIGDRHGAVRDLAALGLRGAPDEG